MERRTLVFYESPHRLAETLIDMEETLGDRQAAVAKELTKMHEAVYRGGLSAILDRLEEGEAIAGEYVIMVRGREPGAGLSMDEALEEVSALMKKGMGRKQAVKEVAAQYGLGRTELYEKSLGK